MAQISSTNSIHARSALHGASDCARAVGPQTATIVSNESRRHYADVQFRFRRAGAPSIGLYPEALRPEIDTWNARIYPSLNNGVYRAGFATTQAAYEEAYHGVFAMLDQLEHHLGSNKFLVGERLTEADIRLFVTLVRFDVAYYGLFKCNRKRIADYPALTAYLNRMLALPEIRETVNIDHIKQGYYSIPARTRAGSSPSGRSWRIDYNAGCLPRSCPRAGGLTSKLLFCFQFWPSLQRDPKINSAYLQFESVRTRPCCIRLPKRMAGTMRASIKLKLATNFTILTALAALVAWLGISEPPDTSIRPSLVSSMDQLCVCSMPMNFGWQSWISPRPRKT